MKISHLVWSEERDFNHCFCCLLFLAFFSQLGFIYIDLTYMKECFYRVGNPISQSSFANNDITGDNILTVPIWYVYLFQGRNQIIKPKGNGLCWPFIVSCIKKGSYILTILQTWSGQPWLAALTRLGVQSKSVGLHSPETWILEQGWL